MSFKFFCEMSNKIHWHERNTKEDETINTRSWPCISLHTFPAGLKELRKYRTGYNTEIWLHGQKN